MNPEGQSIKPDDEYIDSEDLGLDKTEGDEIAARENDGEEASLLDDLASGADCLGRRTK